MNIDVCTCMGGGGGGEGGEDCKVLTEPPDKQADRKEAMLHSKPAPQD